MRCMPRSERILTAALVATTVGFFAGWAAFPWDTVRLWGTNLGWLAAPAVAAVAAAHAAYRPRERRARVAWLLVALGSLAWAAGQAFWTWSVLSGRDELPFPSYADVGFLTALPFFAAAILAWPRRRRIVRRDLWDGLVGLAIALLVTFEFAVEPILVEWNGSTESWVALAYPVLEGLVLAPLLIGFLLNTWSDRFRALVLAAGLVALATADAAFSVAVSAGGIWETAYDPLWTVAFVAIGAAATLRPGYAPRRFRRIPTAAYVGVLTFGIATVLLADAVESEEEIAVGHVASYLIAVLMVGGVVRIFALARARERDSAKLRRAQVELRRAQLARDRFMVRLVDTQEADARKIADVLHDDAVQQLTALGFRLELAAQSHELPKLRELAASTSTITESIRRLLVELHPAILESQGLGPAIEIAAERLRAVGTVVEVDGFPHRLPRETEVLAYRVVQQALEHVAVNGRASRTEVRLVLENEHLRVEITDDGSGDDLQEDGVGLIFARERVELAGGRFLFLARKDSGTVIRFELPLLSRAALEEATA